MARLIGMMDTTVTVILFAAQGLLTVIAALIGWLVKGLSGNIDGLKRADALLTEEITRLRVSLPERYVSKADHKEALDAIFSMLRRIEDKLDQKADRHP